MMPLPQRSPLPTRTPANLARDPYRHPAETLAFFGVKPSDTVVELWPGGGWYTEILAPLAKSGGGTLYVAGTVGTRTEQDQGKSRRPTPPPMARSSSPSFRPPARAPRFPTAAPMSC